MRRVNDIASVTRAQSFTSAAATLASASDHLKTEAQHQTKYWEQLASLRSSSWPVSRMPNDTKALVVHYGSAESGPQYRNRGVAALLQDENGDLTFPGRAQSQKPNILSVTVHRHGRITGRFAIKEVKPATSSKLEDDLLQAREALFQEELFNEASKEARLLSNMGVKTRSSSIEVLVSGQCSVAVSYTKQTFEQTQESQADNEFAKFVGSALRLMLSAEHQQKHAQRAEHKPPPISQNPQPAPEYAVLRPVISLLRHHSEVVPLLEILEDYKKSLQLARLQLSIEHQPERGSESRLSPLQELRRVVSSRTLISLPSEESLSIKVETHLAAPRFGTQFSFMQHSGQCGSSSCAETSSYKHVVRFLEDVICRDICTLIMRSGEGHSHWQLNNKYPPELVLKDGDQSLASLAVTCSDGRVAISCVNLNKPSKESAEWNKQEARMTGKDGQQKQTDQGLLDIVESLTTELLA